MSESLFKTPQELDDLFEEMACDDTFVDQFLGANDTQDARAVVKSWAYKFGYDLPKVSDRERLANRLRARLHVSHSKHPKEETYSWWGEQFDFPPGGNATYHAQPRINPADRPDAGVSKEPYVAFSSFACQPKEPTMSRTQAITITTLTLINGVDAKNYSDRQLYDLIASEEAALAELGKIANKPQRLVEEVAKRQAGIDALVAFMNSKDEKPAASA